MPKGQYDRSKAKPRGGVALPKVGRKKWGRKPKVSPEIAKMVEGLIEAAKKAVRPQVEAELRPKLETEIREKVLAEINKATDSVLGSIQS